MESAKSIQFKPIPAPVGHFESFWPRLLVMPVCSKVKRTPKSKKSPKKTFELEFRTPTEALAFFTKKPLLSPIKVVDRFWIRRGFRPIAFQVDFDLSTLGFGVRNSWLLRTYLTQTHLVRCGSVFLKHWSKASGINNSKKGYLTSYAVNVMWIHYLIQKEHVDFIDPSSITSSLDGKGDLSYVPMVPKGNDNDLDTFATELGLLVQGFFFYYSFEFNWRDEVITVSRKGLTKKLDLKWTEENEVMSSVFRERVWYRFCIEDPFEPNLNLGRHVSPIKLHKVKSEFFFAVETLLKEQWERLLKDRSSAVALQICEKNLLRQLVGKLKPMPISTLLEKLKETDRYALASFEVENSTSSLFRGLHGLNVTQSQCVTIDSKLRIPRDAESMIIDIDAKLKVSPLAGVEATEEYRKCNLDTLYHLMRAPFVRFFLTESDASTFKRHWQNTIEQLYDDNGVLLVGATHALSLTDALETELDEILMNTPFADCRVFRTLVIQHVFSAPTGTAAKTSAAKATRVERDRFNMFQGKCSSCKTATTLWQTSDPAKDSGKYCDSCWKKW